MKTVEADPADTSTLGLTGPDALDDLGNRRPCRLVEGHGDEEARLLVQAWRSDVVARSACQVARSSTRTLRARDASRHPTTSVSFDSSIL